MKINKDTKDEIGNLCSSITTLADIISELRDKQQTEYDDKSEGWQESDVGQAANSKIEDLDALVTELEDVAERVDDILL